jgi:regulatory protein
MISLSLRAKKKKGVAGPRTPSPDAMSVAIKFLSYRARSTKEVEEKLKEKGFGPSEIRQTIKRLTDSGYLNDEVFARDRASSRSRTKHWGAIKIASELNSKGVSSEIIGKILGERDEALENESASKALEKWTRKNRVALNKGGKELTLKAMRHLRSKGFSTSVISSTLKDFGELYVTQGE